VIFNGGKEVWYLCKNRSKENNDNKGKSKNNNKSKGNDKSKACCKEGEKVIVCFINNYILVNTCILKYLCIHVIRDKTVLHLYFYWCGTNKCVMGRGRFDSIETPFFVCIFKIIAHCYEIKEVGIIWV